MLQVSRFKFQEKGFTLIEILVYIVVLVLVVGVVTSLVVWVVQANNQVHARNELVAGVEHALSVMQNEIREAQSVYTPTTTGPQLSLETRNNIPAGETSTYVDFFLCGTRLCVKRESQAPRALTVESVEVQTLAFTQVETGGVPSLSMVVEASYLKASHRAQSTASLRVY